MIPPPDHSRQETAVRFSGTTKGATFPRGSGNQPSTLKNTAKHNESTVSKQHAVLLSSPRDNYRIINRKAPKTTVFGAFFCLFAYFAFEEDRS